MKKKYSFHFKCIVLLWWTSWNIWLTFEEKPCRRPHHSFLSSSHFTTLIWRFFPNWPILRPAPKYTRGLQPVSQSPLLTQKCSNISKSKVPNDFHVRSETEKWATIERNCCRKISILVSGQVKIEPLLYISRCIHKITIEKKLYHRYCWSKCDNTLFSYACWN